MKNYGILLIVGLLLVALTITGCAYAVAPVTGTIYGKVKAPVTATNLVESPQTGKAVCKSILGAVALGDCSIDAAMKEGKITKVHHVDFESMNILFVYATFTTIVHGE